MFWEKFDKYWMSWILCRLNSKWELFLCNISSWTQLAENSYTSFHTDDVLYLLKSKSVSPDITLHFDNYTALFMENI